jgi:hypothetical protein
MALEKPHKPGFSFVCPVPQRQAKHREITRLWLMI